MFGYKNIWEEGKYVDVWSIVHVLFGVWGALAAFVFSVSFWPGLILIILVAIGWEIGEITAGVFEYFWNKVMDVVTASVGYIVIFYILEGVSLGDLSLQASLIIVSAVFVFLNAWGWASYIDNN